MLEVRPFEPKDYLTAYRVGPTWMRYTDSELLGFGAAYASHGPAFSAWIDGDLAACGGVTLPWRGLGEGWALFTPVGRIHPAIMHRVVRRQLRDLIVAHDLHRVQAEVAVAFVTGCRWMTALGFHEESLMPGYGPAGETFARFVWLRPGYADGA